jgi:hypothetical protein
MEQLRTQINIVLTLQVAIIYIVINMFDTFISSYIRNVQSDLGLWFG